MFVEHKEQGEGIEAPAKLDERSKVLLDAADLIEKRGHCKGRTSDEQGRICIANAIVAAGKTPEAWDAAYSYFSSAIGDLPSIWNDSPSRTQGEIVAKLRAVALGL